MNARQTKILNILGERKKISVIELSEILHVSDVTMRKDLSLLEKNNLLRRSHGFAAMIETDDVGSRLAFNYETKKNIAQKTLEIIKDRGGNCHESPRCHDNNKFGFYRVFHPQKSRSAYNFAWR